MKKRSLFLATVLLVLGTVLAACGPTPEPQIVEKIVTEVVEVVKTEVVEVAGTPEVVEKVVTEVVEKEVVVTATPEPEAGPPPLSGEPAFGGTLNIAWRRTSLMPWDWMTNSENVSRDILVSVMDTLVAFGEDYSIVPSLAESWEVSGDGLTYTFYLRRGIKFHDGSECTSEDVIASLDRYLAVGGRRGSLENHLASYEAVDDYTVVMQIRTPLVAFLDVLAMPTFAVAIYPKEIIEGRTEDDLTPDEVIGTGPYQVVEWVEGEIVHLVRFEDYEPLPGERDGAAGAKIAYFDEIKFITVPEFGAELAGLQTGEYDIIWDSDYGSADLINADPNLKIVWNNHGGVLFGIFGADVPWMDLKFRQAVQAGLDMEALALASTGNCPDCFQLDPSGWPEFSVWHVDEAPWHSLYNQHDLEKAKSLLAESSYNGEEFEIASLSFYAPYANASRELVDQLTQMGIKAKISEYGDISGYNVHFAGDRPRPGLYWLHALSPILISPEWWASVWSCEPTYTYNPNYCSDGMEAILNDLTGATSIEAKTQACVDWEQLIYNDALSFPNHAIVKPTFVQRDIMGMESWYTYRLHGMWRAQPAQ